MIDFFFLSSFFTFNPQSFLGRREPEKGSFVERIPPYIYKVRLTVWTVVFIRVP